MERTITRKDIQALVNNVTDDYLEVLYWTVQQFAAKGLNEAAAEQ